MKDLRRTATGFLTFGFLFMLTAAISDDMATAQLRTLPLLLLFAAFMAGLSVPRVK